MKGKVIIALNTAWNLYNFRAGLIRTLIAEGYEVVAIAPSDEYAGRLSELGCRFVPLAMDNGGTHLGRDLTLLWRFYRLLRRERPSVFLGYTVKPNVYGSLAAHALGIPVVNNIAGLGAVFINDSWLTRLVRGLYRVALSRSAKVFFQNEDDRQLFVEWRLVQQEVTDRVPGSGLDLTRFSPGAASDSVTPSACPAGSRKVNSGEFLFLLIARMLWDKGVGEYVAAARILKRSVTGVDFCLLGFVDVQNPAAISREQMEEWVIEGVVKYLGISDDVQRHIAAADCVVLPSYREGLSRTLLEAAAMGCPIITTDVVGCREIVDDGVNGLLCRPRDAADLAEKMRRMITLSSEERAEMGRRGRDKVEREFDERIVIGKYLKAIADLVSRP